jgi:hypothetical protein
MSRVLVLGGYGAVGAVTTRALAEAYPGDVICAGRRMDRATRAAAAIPGVHAAALDVTDPQSVADALDRYRPALVVLAVEPPDARTTRLCLERGIHVVDVSATAALLQQTEQMGKLARERRAAAVLSVGLAPGLTNILARRVHDELDGAADELDISVLIGSGERHGTDGIRWTVRQLAQSRTQVDPGPLTVELPGLGRRRAHPFPFSDQVTLRRTLPAAAVTTRLCLDSRAVTMLLFGAQRAGAFRLARSRRGVEGLTRVLERVHVGGERFAVRVDGRRGSATSSQALTGSQQSRTTGLVAARVAQSILDDRVPTGVHHVDQLDALLQLPEQLAVAAGLRVWHGPPQTGRDRLDLKLT